jgi:hypothetical protein
MRCVSELGKGNEMTQDFFTTTNKYQLTHVSVFADHLQKSSKLDIEKKRRSLLPLKF